jgi:triosephosphate isomerase
MTVAAAPSAALSSRCYHRASIASARRGALPAAASAPRVFGPHHSKRRGVRRDDNNAKTTTTVVARAVDAATIASLETLLPSNRQPRARTPLMAGNWKMNPKTLREAESLAALVAAADRAQGGSATRGCDVLVCPPAPFLPAVAAVLAGSSVKLGAQNVSHEPSGAFTGEMSLAQAVSVGCDFALVGHSERRELFHETDALVGDKTRAILDAGLAPVICVGESKAQYDAGLVRDVCATQLHGALRDVSTEELERGKIVIAYEPVWAIGTGLTATPAIAQSVHAFIRGWIEDVHGPMAAAATRIQYGGSVKPDSVDELMRCPDVDGCLVGGASLNADHFSRIFGFDDAPSGPTKLWATEVVTCRNELGESPVWDAETETLYWVDAPGKAVWSWNVGASGAPVKVHSSFTLVPIRPRWRGERRSLRTNTSRRISPRTPRFQRPPSTPFNSTSDAFQLHPDVRSYGTTLSTRSARSSASSR